MKARLHAQQRKGFTLVELLTVIAIIALLAAILFPVITAVRRNAREGGCMSNMQSIVQAIKMYRDDWRVYPDALYNISYNGGPPGLRLAQDYVKDPDVFTCPEAPGALKGSTAAVNPINPMTGAPYTTQSPSGPLPILFQQSDSYDVQYHSNADAPANPLLDYTLKWTVLGPGQSAISDDPRQLVYREPPDNTVITTCLYHSQMDANGNPAPGSVAIVAFLSGRVQKLPAASVAYLARIMHGAWSRHAVVRLPVAGSTETVGADADASERYEGSKNVRIQ